MPSFTIPLISWIILAIGFVVALILLVIYFGQMIQPISWGLLLAALISGCVFLFSLCGTIRDVVKKYRKEDKC